MITTLTVNDVARQLKVSVSTVFRMLKDPEFPRPFKVGHRSSRWDQQEVADYLERRKADATNQPFELE